MKVLPQVKQIFVSIFLVFIAFNTGAQTKLTVSGAKINLSGGVYLSAKDISATSSSAVNVEASTLKIAGSTTSSGSIDAKNGTVELNGTAAQQLGAEAFLEKTIKALTINNTAGATVNDTLNITDVLTVSDGNLISQGFLTLKSNDSNTARVAPVTSLATTPIIGDVIVERFITSKRAYRFLTAPVNASTTIRDNWMEGVYNPNTSSGNINPVPGFGTHITGAGGNLNRFDPTLSNNPSLFTFNNLTQKWVAATNTDTILKAGQALRLFVRGSRSTDLNSNEAVSSITTLRAKGALVTGTVTLTASGAGGTPGMPALSNTANAYNFIANPYASPVDWFSINLNDIAGTIYIFDPTVNGTNGRGGYVAFNRDYPGGVTSNVTSKIDNNIQSGQAFFVQTTGPNPSITFRENYKTSLNRRVFRAPNGLTKMSLQLLLPQQLVSGGAADGLAVYFSDNFSSAFGEEDSYKFTNQDENIAILRDGKTLSIEGRKPVTASDTIPLKMWQFTLKEYIFKIELENFESNIESYLSDAYLHTNTKLTGEKANIISFTITADTLSAASDRFRIIFKNSGTLLTQVPDIKAYEDNQGVQVEWSTVSDNNLDSCIIQKSLNTLEFTTLGAVKVKTRANTLSAYNWLDASPGLGDNYYRIRFINKSGVTSYSRVAKVHCKAANSSVSIVADKSNSNLLTVSFKNVEKGKYWLNLINNNGQKVYTSDINHPGGSAKYSIKLKNLLSAGIYHLQVSGSNTFKNISVLIP